MRLRVLIFLSLAVPSVTSGQTSPNPDPSKPDFTMIVQGTFDPSTLAEFNRRIQEYAALRRRLETGLPPLKVTTDADEIERFERRLGDRIRRARGSRRGQIFSGPMESQVKGMMLARVDPATIAAIMEDGPGEVDIDVNETYAKKHALATMPPNLLLLLPDLPKDLEYRFVGRRLVLRDARANIIIDEIPHAIRCRHCVVEPEDEHATTTRRKYSVP